MFMILIVVWGKNGYSVVAVTERVTRKTDANAEVLSVQQTFIVHNFPSIASHMACRTRRGRGLAALQ